MDLDTIKDNTDNINPNEKTDFKHSFPIFNETE